MPPFAWAVVAVVFIFIVFFLIIAGQFISLWVQAWLSGAYVGFTQLIGMRLRKVDIRTIVISRIRAVKAGIVFHLAYGPFQYCLGFGRFAAVQ